MSRSRLAFARRSFLGTGVALVLGALILSSGADIAVGAGSGTQSGTVSGAVFLDYNDDGVRDANETQGPGSTPITVRAFDSAGDLVGETTTAADGRYTLAYSGATTDALRIEFVDLPSWLEPAAQGVSSNTSVQFVTGPTASADFAVHDPADYCQNNPELAIACFAKYGPDAATEAGAPSVRLFPYNSGTTEVTGRPAGWGDPANTTGASFGDTGSVYGTAWNPDAGRLYLGAFVRQYVELGPAGAHGIYLVDPVTQGVSTFYADPTLDASLPSRASFSNAPLFDPWGNDVVSKAGWGDLEVIGNRLYAVNLTNRSLYAWDLAADGRAAGAPTVVAIPNYAKNAADNRPFALAYNRGQLFIGGMDSAESSGSTSADLDGWVVSVDPATLAFQQAPGVGQELFRFGADYGRGCAWRTSTGCALYTRRAAVNGAFEQFGDAVSVTYRKWGERTSYFEDPSGAQFTVWPMPVFAGLAFDDDGSIVIGLRDRHGDMSLGAYTVGQECVFTILGYDCSSPSRQTGAGWPFGDVLRANVVSPGTQAWTLAPTNHYNGDHALLDGGNGLIGHDQSDIGSLYLKRGSGEVAATAYDTFSSWSGDLGVRWHTGPADWPNPSNPDRTSRAYTAFQGCMSLNDCPQPFRKNNGLGDLEALCDQAPIEIGNRVWLDANANGVQDAGESPIAGVTIDLRHNGVVIGSTLTAVDGTYYFGGVTNRNLNSGEVLDPNTAYDVVIVDAVGAAQQAPLAGLSLTTAHAAATSADPDLADSDGVLAGSEAIVPITTGRAGANDHTFDFGFVSTAVTTTTAPTTTAGTTTTAATTTTAGTTTTAATTTSVEPPATTVYASTTTVPGATTTAGTTTTSSSEVEGSTAAAVPARSVGGGSLPFTGSATGPMTVLGLGMIGVGLVLGRFGSSRQVA